MTLMERFMCYPTESDKAMIENLDKGMFAAVAISVLWLDEPKREGFLTWILYHRRHFYQKLIEAIEKEKEQTI